MNPSTSAKASKMTRLTVKHLALAKQNKNPLVAITAYDANFARLVDAAGVDIILVGDSLGNTTLGFENTVPVTLAMMQHHGAAVMRGSTRALVGVDLPFGTYHAHTDAELSQIRDLIQNTGCQFVKLEGAGAHQLELVQILTSMGIAVMGHLGYTPQQVHRLGGPKASGKNPAETLQLRLDAEALANAGVCALVLEMLPQDQAETLSDVLKIPTIGIGSGPHCDGQILVLHDVLGLDERFAPKFAKRYANFEKQAVAAVKDYADEVRKKIFPETPHNI